MPGIEELHFEVILDHSKFDQEIKKVESLAKGLNTDVSKILDLKKQINAANTQNAISEQKIAQETAKTALAQEKVATQKEKTKTQAEKTATAAERHARAVSSTNTQLVTTQSLVSTIAQLTGVAFGVAGLRAFTSELINITGQFEVQKMALTSMLQSADKADEIFNQLRKNALESPYTFADLTKFAKQLTAFNIPADKLVETEKMLADVAAAVGVDMGRIILAYGQVKAAGALKGQELRQFTEAGVPILEELAKQIEETEGKAVSLSEVFARISKKQIPFAMVEEAFKRMTSEGGKFYKMQEVLVETLQGKIGKLRDVWQQALYDLGQSQSKILKGSVDLLTGLVGSLNKVGEILPGVAISWGAYKVAVLVADVATKTFTLSNYKLLTALTNVGKWISTNPYAILVATLVALGYQAVKSYQEMNAGQIRFQKALKDNDEELSEEIERLDEVYVKLKYAQKGTKEWTEAKDEAVRIYGKYRTKLGEEIEQVGNLATAYDDLKASIIEATRTRQLAAFEQQEEEAINQQNAAYLEKISKEVYKKFSRAEAYLIVQEINDALRTGSGIEKLLQNQTIARLLATQNSSYTYGQQTYTTNFLKSDIQYLLTQNAKARKEYLDNVRSLVREYNLTGTILDPDFVGPVAKPGTIGAKESEWGDDWQSVERKRLEDRIDLLKRFKEAYDKLVVFVGEDKVGAVLKSIFDPTGANGYSFNNLEQQIYEAIDALAALSPEAAKDAAKMRSALKLDTTIKGFEETKKATEAAEKALERYYAALEKIQRVGGGTASGSGWKYNVTKIASDTNNALKELSQLRVQAEIDLKASGKPQDEIDAEMEVLERYFKAQRDSIWAGFYNKLENNTIKDLFEAAMGGFDLHDWNDKTIAQFREIEKVLDNLTLPNEFKEWFLSQPTLGGEEKLKEYEKTFNEFIKSFRENTFDPEKMKAYAKFVKQTWNDMKPMLGALEDYAKEAAPEIQLIIEGYTQALSMMFNAVNRLLKKDVPGALVAVFATIATEIIKAATEAERLRQKLAELRAEIDHDLFMDALSNSGQSIFGTDNLARLQKGIEGVAKATADLNKGLATTIISVSKINPWGWLFGTAKPEDSFEANDIIGLLNKRNLAVYDNNGIINKRSIEALAEIGDITEELATKIIDAIDKYYGSVALVNEVMEELVGNIADAAAENIVNSWIEAGNAALDYASILDDVARSYAQMVVKSMIMQAIPEGLAEELAQLAYNNDREGFMATLAAAMQKLEAITPYIQDALQAFDPYIIRETDEEGSLGKGIKSITEETASILASYLNAVRADVSVLRSIAERQAAGNEAWGAALPTLQDYIQKIEAHTANTADNTARILSNLQAVLSADGTMLRVDLS